MSGRTHVTDNRVTQAVQPGAPAGRYTVTWRVTSIDGHPVSGSFGFTATAAAPGHRPQAAPVTAGARAQAPSTETGVAWWVYAVGAAVVAAVAAAALARRRPVG